MKLYIDPEEKITVVGSNSNASPTLTGLSKAELDCILVGYTITGTDIPASTTITAVNYADGEATMSANATDTSADETYTFDGFGLVRNPMSYPDIVSRLDMIGTCAFTIVDRLGALYASWFLLDDIVFKVEDDNSNILFQGFIVDKIYKHNVLTISARGLGAPMEWKNFNQDYILAEGNVKTVPSATGATTITDEELWVDAAVTFEWLPEAPILHIDMVDESSGSSFIYADSDSDNDVDVFSFNTISDVDGVTSVTIALQCRTIDELENTTDQIAVDIEMDGWEGAQNFTFPSSKEWVEETWNGAWSQADLNGLQVKITAPAAIGLGATFYIFYVKAYITYTTKIYSIDLEDDSDPAAAFEWTPDDWVTDRDVGLMIMDTTDSDTTTTYTATAVAYANESANNGLFGTINLIHDNAYCEVREDGWNATYNATITPTIEGDNIATSNTLKEIRIYYKIGLKCDPESSPTVNWVDGTVNLQILYNNTTWQTKTALRRFCHGGYLAEVIAWAEGTEENSGYITIRGTDAELAKYMKVDGGNYTDIEGIRLLSSGFSSGFGGSAYFYGYLDYLKVEIDHYSEPNSPVMTTITDNGASWLCDSETVWTEEGVAAGDRFYVGENTGKILNEVMAKVGGAGVGLDVKTTFTKYMARNLRGSFAIDVLRSICDLEGCHWYEDYEHNVIVVVAEADMEDTGINLTNADYLYDWEFHDTANEIGTVHVFGNAALRVHYIAQSSTSSSEREKIFIDDKIMTNPDAKEVADNYLAELESKQPQIKIPLQGVNYDLQVGKTVTLTMVNPTVAEADHVISKVERKKGGYISTDDIWTTIYCGLGHSTPQEKMVDAINRANYQGRKAAADRLSGTPFSTSSGSISWSDIAGKPATFAPTVSGVEDVIDDEIVGGQSIDNAIDALIVTHAATQHDRLIAPTRQLLCTGGYTAATNNVYFSSQNIVFGRTSLDNNKSARIFFKLPSDYVSGEDFDILWAWTSATKGDVVDYKFQIYSVTDGVAAVLEQTIGAATWTGANVSVWETNHESVTVTGTNFDANDIVYVYAYMQDAGNAHESLFNIGCNLLVPVNTSD